MNPKLLLAPFLSTALACLGGEQQASTNATTPPGIEMHRFSLAELGSRTWQRDGKTVKLLREIDLRATNSQHSSGRAMIYGFPDTGVAICIEFYGYRPYTWDDRQYCLLQRDWSCPPLNTIIRVGEEKGNIVIDVAGDSRAGSAVRHYAYYYTLTPEFRLLHSPGTFESNKQ
jgi:hypothetical protein